MLGEKKTYVQGSGAPWPGLRNAVLQKGTEPFNAGNHFRELCGVSLCSVEKMLHMNGNKCQV